MNTENEFFDDGKIECKICGKKFTFITEKHLNTHDITTKEYKQKYPDAKISGGAFSAKQKYRNKKLLSNTEEPTINKNPDKEEPDIKDLENQLPLPSDPNHDFDNIIFKDVNEYTNNKDIDFSSETIEKQKNEKFSNIKIKPKLDVAKCLYEFFPEIEVDYEVSFKNPDGSINESFITDFAEPYQRFAFFFPDVFWHNDEEVIKDNKYTVLRENNWRVIIINGRNIIKKIIDMF